MVLKLYAHFHLSYLNMVRTNKLVLQLGDIRDTLSLEGLQSNIESLLLGEQSLNAGQIPAILVRLDVGLLVGNPGLDNVGLPHEAEIVGVVLQVGLSHGG